MKKGPLEGITVLDFGWVIAAPYGTRILRDMGATVIRLETGTRIDPARLDTRRPGVDANLEGGWAYYDLHRSKMDLCLNLKSSKAKEILYKLIREQIDVVVANFAPKAFHKLGIDHETLSRIKEDIIVLNASGLGDNGPYRDYLTYAPIMQCLSGVTSLIGYENETPFGYSGIVADYIGGIAVASLISSALYYRKKTGKGQFIDLSSTESMLSMMGLTFLEYQINGRLMKPAGDHHFLGQIAPHNCYRCKGDDNWCVISATDGQEWESFKEVLRPECGWVDDDIQFNTLEDRLLNQAELDKNISAWTQKREKKEIVELLQTHNVSAAMVQDGWETINDEHALKSGYIRTLDFGDDGRQPRYLKITGNLIHFDSQADEEYDISVGKLGAHNEYICKEMLNMSDDEYTEAEADKAFI